MHTHVTTALHIHQTHAHNFKTFNIICIAAHFVCCLCNCLHCAHYRHISTSSVHNCWERLVCCVCVTCMRAHCTQYLHTNKQAINTYVERKHTCWERERVYMCYVEYMHWKSMRLQTYYTSAYSFSAYILHSTYMYITAQSTYAHFLHKHTHYFPIFLYQTKETQKNRFAHPLTS